MTHATTDMTASRTPQAHQTDPSAGDPEVDPHKPEPVPFVRDAGEVILVRALRSPDVGTMSERVVHIGEVSERCRSKTVSDRHCSDVAAVSEQLSEQLRKTTSAP